MLNTAQTLDEFLALPDGGGIIDGFDPVIRADGFTGAAALSVPMPVTPARGVSPELALSYSSSAGNGQVGVGFSLSVPSISRMTNRGVPEYHMGDALALSGVGQLTPALDPGTSRAATRTENGENGTSWLVRTFLPCQESALPLIEQWTDTATGISFWRVVGALGETSLFGITALGRVSDPADPARIFQWLIEETIDPRGNRIAYEYKAEDGAAVRNEIYERNRMITAARYPERIRYGNYEPGGPAAGQAFAFEVVFDYGEYDLDVSGPHADPCRPVRPWPERADPFSSYRAGFEIRTYRLCRGVLLFHHLPALGARPCLVRATRLGYREDPGGSLLTSVTATGYRRQDDGSYLAEPMPPLELTYSRFAAPAAPPFRLLHVQGGHQLAGYLAPGACQPVDLDGDGLPGFLMSSGETAWYYPPEGHGRYGAPAPLPAIPDTAGRCGTGWSVADLDGDGGLQLLAYAPAVTGYFTRTRESWSQFTPLPGAPTMYAAPRGELADLDGDGRSELMFVNRDELVFYPSLGSRGFGPPRSVPRPPGFPAAGNAGATEVVSFAGLMGDGLMHRVRVTDGEVTVWPNLGHGRFGPPVQLAGAPRLTAGLSASRVHLADVDGSGTTDLVLVFPDRLQVYRNQSGNGFAPPLTVPLPVPLSRHDQVSFGDVLGTGTTAIVISRMTGAVQHWYCDLCETRPGEPASVVLPNLLTGADNNLGGTGAAQYGSSTGFLLADKQAGRPWPTRMPAAVPVVTRTVSRDLPGAAVTTTTYRYHDGYYDPWLRQFSGFGCTESVQAQEAPVPAPAARTRTWYHTGAYTESAALGARRRAGYYAGDPGAYRMPDSVLAPAVTQAGGETARQAYLALAGQVLRTEAWGDDPDDAARSAVPYTVTDQNYTVRLVQAAGPHGPGSFYVTTRETVTSEYGTDPGDPRVEHVMLLESTLAERDGEGTYRELAARVAYPRRPVPASGPAASRDRVPEQEALLISAQDILRTRHTAAFRVIGLPVQDRNLDIGGLTVPASGYFSFTQLCDAIAAAVAEEIPYGVPFTPGQRQSRPAAWQRTFYWNAAQTAALAFGEISPAALEHHQEQAAFSDAWLAEVYGSRAGPGELEAAGYRPDGLGTWWSPDEVTSYFGPGRFCLPVRQESYASHTGQTGPYALVIIGYDEPYLLVTTSVTGYADASTPVTATGVVDYQAAALSQVTDPNGVVSQVRFDPLRRVLARSVFKPADGGRPRTGDMDLAHYLVHPDATFWSVLTDQPRYLQGAAAFFYYEQLAWMRRGSPAAVVALVRPEYVSEASNPPRPAEVAIAYSDGSGRLAQHRQEAEAAQSGPQEPRRWIVSGTSTYAIGDQPAQEFLPFYAPRPEYGLPPRLPAPQVSHYDAVGRLVRVDTPKGFITRTVFTPWQHRRYDTDDTMLDSPFYAAFMAGYPADPTPDQRAEKAALDRAAAFYDTPGSSVLDNAGHPVRDIKDSLGNIGPDAFAGIAGDGITARELWDELHAAGYLVTRLRPVPHTTVTGRFEPYTPGFALRLGPRFQPFAEKTADLLRKACLTSLASFDQQGRIIAAADPRLFYAAIRSGTPQPNVTWSYPMSQPDPALIASTDAGPRLALADVLGRVVTAWDGRELRQARTFDGLNRPLKLTVRAADGTARTLEEATYGEHQPDAADANLIGRLYQLKDEAGIAVTSGYTIAGQPGEQERRYPADYAAEPDWARDVPLDPGRYLTTTRYDGLGRIVAQVTPDGTRLSWAYHVSGRIASASAERAGATTAYLADAGYNAAGQRVLGRLGNGAEQVSHYDEATQELTRLVSGVPGRAPVQQVAYTYDPAGNLMVTRDQTAALALGRPQPDGTGDCSYDADYRLLTAAGLQHPGIDATTYATGFKQTLFMPLRPARPDPAALNSYTETYAYDDAGNLVRAEHTADGVTFPWPVPPVAPGSNRMAGVPYDGAGHPLTAPVNGPMALSWDARGHLASTQQRDPEAGGAERAGGAEGLERTWMSYDMAGQRSRKVVELFDASGQLARVTDVRYLGSYVAERVATPQDPMGGEVTGTILAGDGQHVIAVVPSAGPMAPAAASPVRYQVNDRLGSASVELGGDAAVLSYEGFLPWGGSSVIAASDQAAAEPKVLRYSGQEADDSTSLYSYSGRYLAPWLGRWLSPDPAGEADGLNLYAFVHGNPVTLIDPDGRGGGKPDQPRRPFRVMRDWVRPHRSHYPPPPPPPSQIVTSVSRFVAGFVEAFPDMYYVIPQRAIGGLRSLLRPIYDGRTPQERELDAENLAIRQEQTRLRLAAVVRNSGRNPALWLPQAYQPQTAPLATWKRPFAGRMLDRQIRAILHDPSTYGALAAAGVAGGVTSGLVLGVARRLLTVNMPVPVRVASWAAMSTFHAVLVWRGYDEESNLVNREYRARLRQASLPRLVRWGASWLPAGYVGEGTLRRLDSVLGDPGGSVYDLASGQGEYRIVSAHQARRRERNRERANWAWAGLAAGLAFRFGFGLWMRRPAPVRAVTIWRPPNNALAIIRPRSAAVMLVPPTSAGQAVLALFQPRNEALALQRQRMNALMVLPPPANRALAIIPPANRALVVQQGQGNRAPGPGLPPGALAALVQPMGGAAALLARLIAAESSRTYRGLKGG